MSQTEPTALQLIMQSRNTFEDILYHFREFHDLCEKSQLFTPQVILDIDRCAVTFRQMVKDTASVASIVSNQWLDSTIMFFENIEDVTPDEFKDTLVIYGEQAKEIGTLFKILSAWAGDLCGRFHKAQDSTVTEAEEFKAAFYEAVKKAEGKKEVIGREVGQKAKVREDAEEWEGAWKKARNAVGWFPLGYLITQYGVSVGEGYTVDAVKIEEEARSQYRKAKKELKKREKNDEKAKFIAKKAGELVKFLHTIEKTCEDVGSFWMMEADKFISQGGKMEANQAKLPASLTNAVSRDNIKVWKEAKGELDTYVHAMTTVGACFNFTTDAKLPPMTKLRLAKLKFDLCIPLAIDVRAITSN